MLTSAALSDKSFFVPSEYPAQPQSESTKTTRQRLTEASDEAVRVFLAKGGLIEHLPARGPGK